MTLTGHEIITSAFEVGKTYATRAACNWDCIYTIEVVSRTAKTITYVEGGKTNRRKIHVWRGVESVSDGAYSMAASWSADQQTV